MKITYTASNRAHHYPYAEALDRNNLLYAFISGFSRFSPRSPLPAVGNKLERHDFFQNLYLASLKFRVGYFFTSGFSNLSNYSLDLASYKKAKESDIFIFYRTQGYHTTLKLQKEKSKTICIMEEVNSHVDTCYFLMNQEYQKLGMGKCPEKFADHQLRLKTYDQVDYILCPSEFVRNSFLEKGFSFDRLLKINYGFNIPIKNIKENKKEINDRFTLLYVGQIHYRKGLRYAIEAFRRLNHPGKEFIIVGPETPFTGIDNITLPEGVRFTGSLKGKDLEKQYMEADAFVLPSIEDGFGLVIMEAMSYGVPVILTSNTGACDVVTNGKEGFIVPPGDSEKLFRCFQEMAEDKKKLKRMSEAALSASHTLGNWDDSVTTLLGQILEKMNPDKT